MLTQARLKSLLLYTPETGEFTWKRDCGRRHVKQGQIAGTISSRGYRTLSIEHKTYLAHRLVFLYLYGRMPLGQIDHVNRDKSDNRLSNLREVSPSENKINSGIPVNNTSGFKGVHYHIRNKVWVARICKNGERIELGSFQTSLEAAKAYNVVAKVLHGKYAFDNLNSLKRKYK